MRIRVRRGIDDKEMDFDSKLDKAAIRDFVGDGNGFIVEWADQSDLDNALKNFAFELSYSIGVIWLVNKIKFIQLKPWVAERLKVKQLEIKRHEKRRKH